MKLKCTKSSFIRKPNDGFFSIKSVDFDISNLSPKSKTPQMFLCHI